MVFCSEIDLNWLRCRKAGGRGGSAIGVVVGETGSLPGDGVSLLGENSKYDGPSRLWVGIVTIILLGTPAEETMTYELKTCKHLGA